MSSYKSIESLLQEQVLSLFALPDGDLAWKGDGELDMERFVYYFCINNEDYLLVNELSHGASDSMLANLLVGNAVAPHQKVVPVPPKEGQHTYVNISGGINDPVLQLRGDFSVFQVLHWSLRSSPMQLI